jgi:hypothetical protein
MSFVWKKVWIYKKIKIPNTKQLIELLKSLLLLQYLESLKLNFPSKQFKKLSLIKSNK